MTFKPRELPALPYDYNALEPVISAEIMELHHKKHHNAYITNYNAAMEKYLEAEGKGDIAAMIALQPALRFNGGGDFLFCHVLVDDRDVNFIRGGRGSGLRLRGSRLRGRLRWRGRGGDRARWPRSPSGCRGRRAGRAARHPRP